MRKEIMAVLFMICCAGCSTVTKYKGVSVEYNAQGQKVRRVESESASQTLTTSKKLSFKHLEM